MSIYDSLPKKSEEQTIAEANAQIDRMVSKGDALIRENQYAPARQVRIQRKQLWVAIAALIISIVAIVIGWLTDVL